MLSQWRSLAREVAQRTAIVVKFLSILHVTNTYIFTSSLVRSLFSLPIQITVPPQTDFYSGACRCTVQACSRPSIWPVTCCWWRSWRWGWGRWDQETWFSFGHLKTLERLWVSAFWEWKVIGSLSLSIPRTVANYTPLWYAVCTFNLFSAFLLSYLNNHWDFNCGRQESLLQTFPWV